MENFRKFRDRLILQAYNDLFAPFLRLLKSDNHNNLNLKEEMEKVNKQVGKINEKLLYDVEKGRVDYNCYNKNIINFHKPLTISLSTIYMITLSIIVTALKIKNKKGVIERLKLLLFVLIKRIKFLLYSLPFILIEYIILNFIIKKIFITDNEIKMNNCISLIEEKIEAINSKNKVNNLSPEEIPPENISYPSAIKKIKIPYIFISYEQIYEQMEKIRDRCCLCCYYNFRNSI